MRQLNYRQEFGELGMRINDSMTANDWMEVYKRLVFWELQLTEIGSDMREMLRMQKQEANLGFAKFVKRHYEDWITGREEAPLMSNHIFKQRVFPLLDRGEKVFVLIIDNFRFDQWKAIQGELADLFTFDEELYYSILPTVTQYARNAICSGLMPLQIQQLYPSLWVDEDEDEGKNLNEKELLQTLMERYRRKESFSYHKLNDSIAVDKLLGQFNNLLNHQLNVMVINFIDILSHSKSENQMVHELVGNEAAFRSITLSWFRHTSIRYLFREIARSGYRVIITTDHGSVQVNTPVKIIGDRQTNSNLRFKVGKNLSYKEREVVELRSPQKVQLPSPNLSSAYVLAFGDRFFAYPNNYNYYASFYKGTFQHGGISMEEMIIPLIKLTSKEK